VSSVGGAGEVTNRALKGDLTTCGIFIGSGTVPNAAVTAETVPAWY
jgi:hypothetical protein